MNSGGSYSAPKFTATDKDEKYHEQWARFVVNHSISDDWRNSYTLMSELYKFVEDGSNGELTQHLQKATDGSDNPAFWISLNTLPTKVDVLVGELETRGYDIRVRALNKEAYSRKLEEKERLRVKRRLQPLFQQIEQETGLPMGEQESVPQTEAELSEYMDLGFKDKVEIFVEAALKYTAKRFSWDEERKALWRDTIIVNRAFVKNEIIRGIPQSRRIHPLNMIFDTTSKKDDLSDSSYFGELEYLPLPSAAERFNLSEEELKRVYGAYSEYQGMNPATEAISTTADYNYGFNTIGGGRLKWFKMIDGELKVLVARAVWRDYNTLNRKSETNKKYGTEHLQKLPDGPREKKDNVISKKIEVWKQCTIIGGHIIREWGDCPNQPRDLSDISVTEPPYKAWIPNYSTGRGVSKVEQLAPIQLLKDIAMYQVQLAMTRAGAKGLSYDLAMLPDGWTPEKMMKYMRVFGVNFYNSKEYQFTPGSSAPPFKEFDQTMSDSVEKYVSIMEYLDAQQEKISGISPERQGGIQGASQGLGVTQAAIFQSNLVTQPLFVSFERFCSRVLSHQAKLIKIAWAGKEEFAPIIGDAGIDFLKENIDLELEELGVIVESLPPIFQDRSKLEGFVSLAVQGGQLSITDALAIMVEPDTRVAIRKLQRKTLLKEMLQMQQAQAEQQQQADLEERLAALEAEQQDRAMQGQVVLQDMKNKGAQQRSDTQGRVKLSSDKIKLLGDAIKINNQPPPKPTTKTPTKR